MTVYVSTAGMKAEFRSAETKSYLNWLFMRLLGKVENREDFLFLGQWDGEVQEGVKGDGDLKENVWVKESSTLQH